MKSKEIKVKFENGRFIPLDSVNFKEGEVIEIEITSEKRDRFAWRGALKDLKLTSVELQHKIKNMW